MLIVIYDIKCNNNYDEIKDIIDILFRLYMILLYYFSTTTFLNCLFLLYFLYHLFIYFCFSLSFCYTLLILRTFLSIKWILML